MSEELNGKQIFSLHEVSLSIQHTFAEGFPNAFWIKAELNKLNFYQQSGHCFPDLVEKKDGKIIAQVRSNLWKSDYQRINNIFLRVLKEPLKDGIKILFLGSISYHPEYGLSLRIIDIDPNFSLGDLEREKQETIATMKEKNIFDKNRYLVLPKLPQRIAIISVESSKGYADFLQVLEKAQVHWRYRFFHLLFPSLLQSDKAVGSITGQLQLIKKVISHFDVVAIIRGGGAETGLSCYNNYELARAIALFPIPVITGIGHSTNETVVEMIAYENAITPTKLAEWLVQQFHNFSVPLQKAEEKIIDRSKRLLKEERSTFVAAVNALFHQAHFVFKNERDHVNNVKEGIAKDIKNIFRSELSSMQSIEKNIANMSPKNVMKRGYSITLLNGKAITNSSVVSSNDTIKTVLYEGSVDSKVISINKPSGNE